MHPLSPLTSTNLVLVFHKELSINWFRSTLRTIKSMYKFISVEDIESYYYDKEEYNNCCHICFDDGDRLFYENALPVLKEENIPATLFCIAKGVIIGESNYWFQELKFIRNHLDNVLIRETICEVMGCNFVQIKKYAIPSIFKCMKIKDILRVIDTLKEKHDIKINKKYNVTKDELYEINNSNIMTIAAHTMNHPILSNETHDDAEKEITESVKELSKMLDRDIKYFAYPNGKTGLDYSIREQLILQENKIKLAFTSDPGFFLKKTNSLSIPRGGFAGLKRENKAWILAKLFFTPIWGIIKRNIETKERKEIKGLSIC